MARARAKNPARKPEADPISKQRSAPAAAPVQYPTQEYRDALFAAALANGTFAPEKQYVCHGCRQWVDGLYFRTLDGLDLCRACAPQTDAPKPLEAIASARVDREQRNGGIRRYRPNIEDLLIVWASEHFREAFEAYAQRDEWEWECKVLAAIVRKRAAADSDWVVRLARSPLWRELLELAPYVVRAGGYPLAAGQTFADWVEEVRACPV